MNEGGLKRRGGRANHSVLAPHFEAIRQWRQQGRTWKEIATLLYTDKGIVVTLYAPYRFIRRRLAHGAHWEDRQFNVIAAKVPTNPPASVGSSRDPIRKVPALPSFGFQKPNRHSFNSDDYL